ncbi:MAG: Na+/H+ antiporter subunit E [Verrucomicrobia bacterium]|nr:Na+/H+ antiporter subunit E [Verrucomicrobiota bacterium]MDA1067740.1 Na+/H+ antiporter subunit E [Verrucomicrobiota bacterium]
MYRVVIFLILFGGWVVLSGQFDYFHITLGVLSCLFITLISSSFYFTNRSKGFANRLAETARIPGYLLWLLWEIILSNVHILRLALTPGEIKDLDPSLVRVKTKLKTDYGKYILANSITLTPGTITIDIEGDELLIHSISRHTKSGVESETMEQKISKVFEGGDS